MTESACSHRTRPALKMGTNYRRPITGQSERHSECGHFDRLRRVDIANGRFREWRAYHRLHYWQKIPCGFVQQYPAQFRHGASKHRGWRQGVARYRHPMFHQRVRGHMYLRQTRTNPSFHRSLSSADHHLLPCFNFCTGRHSFSRDSTSAEPPLL